MSAIAQVHATEKRVKALIDQHAQTLMDSLTADIGQIRLLQGIIQGLQFALEAQREAYKTDLGG